jgi:hypothetical protein
MRNIECFIRSSALVDTENETYVQNLYFALSTLSGTGAHTHHATVIVQFPAQVHGMMLATAHEDQGYFVRNKHVTARANGTQHTHAHDTRASVAGTSQRTVESVLTVQLPHFFTKLPRAITLNR